CPSSPSPSLRRHRRCPCASDGRPAKGRPPLRSTQSPLLAVGLLSLRATAPCRGLGRSGSPLQGPGRGQPPLHADNMHVAAPPPQVSPTFAVNRCNKRIEQFYAIQPNRTQFKTNFSYKNLDSDTTVGKPQWREGGE
ncbi:hypothetical protein GW17_00052985, partial [Ensete ventricosum]